MRIRALLHAVVAVFVLLCIWVALPAGAQAAPAYPAKPVRLVVPFPPDGATDIIGRLLSERLTQIWGQAVLVENRAGASGMIGADVVAKSPPDGYTVLISSTAEVAINQSLYKKMTYVPERDLAQVTLAAVAPLVLVVGAGEKVKTLDQLVAAARARKKAQLRLGGQRRRAASVRHAAR